MNTPGRIALLFLVMTLGVAGFLYIPRHYEEKARTQELSAALSAPDTAPPLGVRTKSGDCSLSGALPDRECTPGAIFPDATVERICVPGYTKTVRNVPLKLRKILFAMYDVPYPQPRGSYELDHHIPLALGGNNDIANLFPQPAEPAPGFREKDVVEIYLYEEVCAGRADLHAAQRQIADDWLAIYNKLTAEKVRDIRSRYRNWSN